MGDYKHLATIKGQLASYLPGGKIDGHRIDTEFSKIDMTDAKNYMAYKQAMNRMMLENQKVMTKIDKESWMPRWARGGEDAHRYNAAESNINLLKAAEKEFGMFEQRTLAYNQGREQAAQRAASLSVTEAQLGTIHPPATQHSLPPNSNVHAHAQSNASAYRHYYFQK